MRLDRFRAPRPGIAAVLFAVFLVAAVVATMPLSVEMSSRLPSNADGLVFAWTLKAMCGGLAQPWDAFRGNMFFPDTASLLYTEPLVGLALQVAPLCALGVDHVTLYNLTYVIILAMSALGAWLLAREVTGSAPAALVAAVAFAFTTANYDSAGRIQVVASQWTPFCFLYLIRFFRDGKSRNAVLAGGAFSMQALSCTYYEIFLAILLVLSVPLWIELAGGLSKARRLIPGLTLAVLVAAVLVLPVNAAQRRHLGPVLAERPQAFQTTLSFFTDVLPTNLVWGHVLGRSNHVMYDALFFPGALPTGLALLFAVGAFRARKEGGGARDGLKPLVFVGILALLFAFGARVSTPWGEVPGPLSLFSGVPGLGQARVPSRFLMFTRLALAILAACGALRVIARFPGRPWVCAAALALGGFVEHWSVPLDSWVVPTRSQLPQVYPWLKKQGSAIGPILEFPPALQRLRRDEAVWLHTGAFHGIPMANGYSSFRPAWFEFVMETALASPDETLIEVLRALGVRTIVLHPRYGGLPELDQANRQLVDFAERHPAQIGLVKSFADPHRFEGMWSPLGDERVFSVLPGPETPPLEIGAALDRGGWSCRTGEPDCGVAIDGDPATLIRGRDIQAKEQFLKIRFKEPRAIVAVSINLGRFAELFPRDPEIRVLKADEWVVVDAQLDVHKFLSDTMQGSTNPMMRWTFKETTAEGFEIRLLSGGQEFRELGLPEVNAYAPVSSAGGGKNLTDAPTFRTTPR